MSGRLRTSVDSFSIVNGVRQEKAYNLSVSEYSAIIPYRKGRGNLYVLVETIGNFPDHAQVQQRIIEIAQEYFHASGSITAGIRTVIKAANVYLFEENLNAPREQRGVAGITCVVLKDRDAYVGQSGPALLYHIGRGMFQILPKESTWLTSERLQDVDISRHPPLGLRRDIEPDLFHLHVQEGDVLILASTPLAKLVSKAEITSAIAHRDAYSVRENLEALAGGRDASALIIEILEVSPMSAEAAPKLTGTAKRAGMWSRISSTVREMLIPTAAERETAEELLEEEELEEAKGLPQMISLKAALQSIWRFLVGLGHNLALLLSRVLPEPEAAQRSKRQRQYARKDRAKAPAQVNGRWLWIALLIPLAIVLLLAFTRFQHDRARQAHFQQLLQNVQEARTSAQASSTDAERRTKLTEALTLLDEAMQLKPEDTALPEQRKEISEWLDRINHVVRLPLRLLKEFPDTESAKCELSTVIVQGIDVYVLDVGTDRVYKYLLNEAGDDLQVLPTDPVLMRKGDAHGTITIDELLDIAWVEAAGQRGTNTLVILDQKGHTLEYNPVLGLRYLDLADTSPWVTPVAAAGYYGRLYLLDPGANRVLRYGLTNTGYGGSPSDYFQTEAISDISSAVDMAIDGNVYVLHADGRISKYQEGTNVPFPQSNLDEPLKRPSCIFASGFMDEGGYVYVADAEQQRIVQFSKAGEFLQQFRAQDPGYMDALRSLYVDEEQRKIYLINGSKLYLALLPE
nr:hypothetical protein [Chloroflexota bacterium]